MTGILCTTCTNKYYDAITSTSASTDVPTEYATSTLDFGLLTAAQYGLDDITFTGIMEADIACLESDGSVCTSNDFYFF